MVSKGQCQRLFSRIADGIKASTLRGTRDTVCRTGNVKVNQHKGKATYILHRCPIVKVDERRRIAKLNTCGYETNTTKSHINGVLSALGASKKVVQRKGQWYINSQKFEEGDVVKY